MTTKVFRLGKFRRWSALVLGILGFGVLAWLLVMLLRSTSFSQRSISFLLFPLLGMNLFLMILYVYMIWAIWSYRIEFRDNELLISRYPFPFLQPIRFVYENIGYVRRPILKGMIEIIPIHGRPFRFTILIEGGSDAVMDEFEKHLAADKFQTRLREELKRYSRFDKVTIAIIIPMAVVAILFFLPKYIARFVAWETAWSPGVGFFRDIDSFWLNENGDIWLSYSRTFNNSTEIIQITPERQNQWTTELSYFDLVLADSSGQPWIIQSEKVMHWVGTTWKTISFEDYTVWSNGPPAVVGEKYWAIGHSKQPDQYFLVNLDLDTEEIQVIHLPAELASGNFIVRGLIVAPDDSLLVMVTKPDYPVFFYSLKEDKWEKKIELHEAKWRIPVFFGHQQEPRLDFGGFTVDVAGQTWVVIDNQTIPRIGRYDENSMSWQWSTIESDCDLCTTYYEDIVIDDNARVWITAGYGRKETPDADYSISKGDGVDVFIPHWGQHAERVRRYSTDNSNYQYGIGDTDIRRSNDGRVWTADHRLVWIDALSSELPAPLPTWFSDLVDFEAMFAVNFWTIGVFLIWMVVYFFISRFQRRPGFPPNS